jgi:hypothetical protein
MMKEFPRRRSLSWIVLETELQKLVALLTKTVRNSGRLPHAYFEHYLITGVKLCPRML